MKQNSIVLTGLAFALIAVVVASASAVNHLRSLIPPDLSYAGLWYDAPEPDQVSAEPLSETSTDPCNDLGGINAGAVIRVATTGGVPGLRGPTLAPPEPPQLPPAGEVLTVRVEAEQVVAAERTLPD